MVYNPKDFYFKKAKDENYAARSVFKLQEMDQKFKLFRPSQYVLDLGCAPGSWSQYVSKKIGGKGRLLGIDLSKVNLSLSNAVFVQGDAFDETFLQQAVTDTGINNFDLVISDMAPKTTGIRLTDQERSLALCRHALAVAAGPLLKKGGHFVAKIFQGSDSPEFVKEVKALFEIAEISRPKSVRSQSFEIYVLGLKKKG